MIRAALATLGALLALAGASARGEALVSNIDLSDGVDLSLSDTVRMQEFTAGEEGASLGSVEIKFSAGSARLDAPAATLRRWDGSSHVLVAELAGPGTLAAGDNRFYAPESTALDADTVYAVRLEGGGSGVALRGTDEDGESGRSGWSIRDESLHRETAASSYETTGGALMIRANEAGARGTFDPFEPPLAPNLTLSETTSDDGAWTVSWSGAELGDYYTYVEVEETPPGGTASTSTYYEAPGSASISGKTVTGAYSYRVRGCRNICSAWSGSLTVTFAASNDRPVVSAITDQSVAAGGTRTVTVTVTDGDSDDAHTVTANSDDTGVATVSVDGKTLTVTGVSRGEATVEVTATDDSGADNAASAVVDFDVTVPNSRPAVGAIDDATVSRESTLSVAVSVTDADAGDTTHTVRASSDAAGVATVSATGNPLTVTGVSRGTATMSVTATDRSGASNATSATEKFEVTVPNSRPVVGSVSDLTVSRGAKKTETVTVTDGDSGDTHTVSASSDDTGVATVSVSGKTLTLAGVSCGAATISVTATDDSSESNDTSEAEEFDVAVPNTRPALGAIADLTVSRGSPGTRTVTVTDGDGGDTHTVSASSSDTGVATVSVSGKTLTVTAVSRGSATITVTATDSCGASDSTSEAEEFDVTVPNSQPVVRTISDATVSRGSTATRTATVTDGDSGDSHTVTVTSSDTGVATVRVTGKTLTVTGVSCGSATMSVTATDNSGAANAASTAVTFTATVPNRRPAVGSISDLTVSRGSTGMRTARVTDGDSGDTHRVTASSSDEGVATVSASGKTVTVRGASRGTATITVTATDRCGASGSAEFDVTVPNSRPVVGAIPDLTVSRGSMGTETVEVTDGDSGDTHEVTAESSDEDVATVSVDGKTLTVTGVSRGEATITVTAEDDSEASNDASAEVTFKATVPNSQPVVSPISDVTVPREPPGTATVTVGVTDGDSGDTHEVTAISSDQSVATVSVDGKTLTVTGVSGGEATITVTAEDDSEASNDASAEVTFKATVPNSRPVVSPISDVTVPRAPPGTATVTVEVTDGDAGDTHEVTAESSDEGVATVSVSGKTVTVRGVSRGEATITVTAEDDSEASNDTSAEVTFKATVPNSQPVIGGGLGRDGAARAADDGDGDGGGDGRRRRRHARGDGGIERRGCGDGIGVGEERYVDGSVAGVGDDYGWGAGRQ